jgi:FdrA protein
LEEAALLAARLAGAHLPKIEKILADQDRWCAEQAGKLHPLLKPEQCYLRGLYSGGTLCYEAQVIWQKLLREPVYSNAPLKSAHRLTDSTRSFKNTAVDLGEEEFTIGRPHPMIDNDLRIRRIMQEANDPETAVIVLDVVLGYGAHPNPVAELGLAVRRARLLAGEAGRELVFVASVTGTEADPQRLSRQVKALEEAGVVVCNSNANAARLAARIIQDRQA